jgi:hypothetical protein
MPVLTEALIEQSLNETDFDSLSAITRHHYRNGLRYLIAAGHVSGPLMHRIVKTINEIGNAKIQYGPIIDEDPLGFLQQKARA